MKDTYFHRLCMGTYTAQDNDHSGEGSILIKRSSR